MGVYNFLKNKEKIFYEKEKEKILGNINLSNFICNECYELWTPELKSREDFLARLSNFEMLVVKLNNFDTQIKNGGFSQWYVNGYSSDIDEISLFVKESDFIYKDKLIELLDNCSSIITSIKGLDKSDDFYLEDYETRMKILDKYNKNYDNIYPDWNNYLENYIYKNLPKNYIDKVKASKEKISI